MLNPMATFTIPSNLSFSVKCALESKISLYFIELLYGDLLQKYLQSPANPLGVFEQGQPGMLNPLVITTMPSAAIFMVNCHPKPQNSGPISITYY